jgi:hypothetical protein
MDSQNRHLASGSRNLPLKGVADFSEEAWPSMTEAAAPMPPPAPSLDALNLEVRLPRQQMMEQKKLDRFLDAFRGEKSWEASSSGETCVITDEGSICPALDLQ